MYGACTNASVFMLLLIMVALDGDAAPALALGLANIALEGGARSPCLLLLLAYVATFPGRVRGIVPLTQVGAASSGSQEPVCSVGSPCTKQYVSQSSRP